jgi:hypothetical protein
VREKLIKTSLREKAPTRLKEEYTKQEKEEKD